MSRYDNEQEKFYGRVNDVTDIYVGYKINQFILSAILLIVIALFRLNIPIVSFVTSFAVVWGFSYVYTYTSMLLISFGVAAFYDYTEKKSETIVDTLANKCMGNVGKISFLATCVLLVLLSFSNDPQSLGWHALLAPFALLFYLAKAFFGL